MKSFKLKMSRIGSIFYIKIYFYQLTTQTYKECWIGLDTGAEITTLSNDLLYNLGYNVSDYPVKRITAATKKDSCMDFIREAGFNVECENSKSVFAPKAPRSEFIPGFGFDALPIVDSTVEYCTLIAKKQNGEETP